MLGAGAFTGAAYFAGAWVGVHWTVMPEGIAILWPPNAILLAVLLVLPQRAWWPCIPAVACAELLADYQTFSLAESLAFAAINLTETCTTALLLKTVTATRFDFHRFRHVLAFGAIALLAVPAVAALFGATVYEISRGGQTSFATFWRVWWFGDALGLLVITPAVWSLLDWWRSGHALPPAPVMRVSAALVIATALAGHWVFAAVPRDLDHSPVTPFLVLPIVAFAGAHMGIRAAAWCGLALAVVSTAATVAGTGPYAGHAEVKTVLALQEFLAITVFSALALASTVAETVAQRRRAEMSEEALRRANDELERRVSERTAELTVANTELERLAISDALTGAFNRRRFMEIADRELVRARRYDRPLALVLWDLDHFKRINDGYGHLVGDGVLCEATRRARGVLRDSDALARYGGEEFLVLLPETSGLAAAALAERIRAALAGEPLMTDRGPVSMSASFGVTERRDGDSVQTLIERADRALYRAKEEGRNRVCGPESDHRPPLSAG